MLLITLIQIEIQKGQMALRELCLKRIKSTALVSIETSIKTSKTILLLMKVSVYLYKILFRNKSKINLFQAFDP